MPVDVLIRPDTDTALVDAPPLAPHEPQQSYEAPRAGAPIAGRPRRRGGMLRRMITWTVLGLAGFLLIGNVGILVASAWAKGTVTDTATVQVEGVKNFRVVDADVWRSGAPSDAGYRSLVAAGVATVVDLRAEDDIDPPAEWLESQGVDFVSIPVRDGQTPTSGQVDDFLAVVAESDGPVLVHCGAGVGRSGAMVAAYLKARGDTGGMERVTHNLASGPPSLEQIVYAAAEDHDRPNVAVVAASRMLDAPRRIYHNLGF